MSRETQVDKFIEVYRVKLKEAVRTRPEIYVWPLSEVPTVVNRMRAALIAGSYNHDTLAIKWTCKELGIKFTRRAIEAFFEPYQQ